METAAQLQPTVFCWCWCSPSSPTGAGPPPCPPPLPVFFPEKFLKHSELRPGEVHQFRKWELTPPVLLISSGAQQQCGQRSRQRCPVMMAGAGTRSLVSSSFQCQSNNLISAEQLVLDYRLSTLSSPHWAAELISFSYRSIMSQNNTQFTCITWNKDKMGSGVKDRSCITDPLSLHINTHHQGVSIQLFLEPVVLISLGGSELF